MKGKDKCELLKAIRSQIAEQYGLEYHPTECNHKGECAGTCPRCDAELKDLQRQLEEKGIQNIDLNEAIRERVDNCGLQNIHSDKPKMKLQGAVFKPKKGNNLFDTEERSLFSEDRLPGLVGLPRSEEELLSEEMSFFSKEMLQGDIPAHSIPHSVKKKEFFKECPIAGWNFHNPDDFWDELYEGAELALVRDKNNKHDHNAVAVAFAGDYDDNSDDFDFDFIIGYVPRTENEFIAKMMDLGWSKVFAAELTTVKDYGPYADRLRMTIYIQCRGTEECVEHEERLFAQLMDEESFANFTETLYEQGYVNYRWGGFPPDEHELPQEGEKVVFIHKREDNATLYLMHLVAKNEHAKPFFKNPKEELDMVDDCCPYVLTNVKGPIVCDAVELSFLDAENISDHQPEGRLPEFTVDGFKEIFEVK